MVGNIIQGGLNIAQGVLGNIKGTEKAQGILGGVQKIAGGDVPGGVLDTVKASGADAKGVELAGNIVNAVQGAVTGGKNPLEAVNGVLGAIPGTDRAQAIIGAIEKVLGGNLPEAAKQIIAAAQGGGGAAQPAAAAPAPAGAAAAPAAGAAPAGAAAAPAGAGAGADPMARLAQSFGQANTPGQVQKLADQLMQKLQGPGDQNQKLQMIVQMLAAFFQDAMQGGGQAAAGPAPQPACGL